MNLQELIDFHVTGAESCEAYAVTPGASEAKNKDIAKHYTKRAKWHRDAVELMKAGQQRLTVAEQLLRETSDYLDGSTRNAVWCDSILHKKMKAALKPAAEGEVS